MDFATRAHDHNYSFDPIIRSLLDTDFYKLLMLQFIWRKYPSTTATFALKNRTTSVKLAEDIDIADLREQLNHVRTLQFRPNELIWLNGASFAGQSQIFSAGFLDYLRTLRMPEYHLGATDDGQYELTFSGPWSDITLWEIYALAIISELRARSAYRKRTKTELDILFANAKTKLWRKLDALSNHEGIALSEFGTRRRAGFLWQEWATLLARDMLGSGFVGTSNAYLAFKHGLEAVGTNAHELPMVIAALEGNDAEKVKQAQYRVLQQWQGVYRGNLLVALPDTFGTTQFLEDAPIWVREWRGFRPDSKNPFVAGEELIQWWKHQGVDPKEKLILFSDGLDAQTHFDPHHGESIQSIYKTFKDRVNVGFGWGTNMTNNFRNCDPRGEDIFDPISLVCKIAEANGKPAVKLSDNYHKATGPADAVEFYRSVFGTAGQAGIETLV